MEREHPDLPWCRYADDGLVHCRSETEAEAVKARLRARLAECQLELHPTKTKIVYCRDSNRNGPYPNVMFDFLGYAFGRERRRINAAGNCFAASLPLSALRPKVHEGDDPGLGNPASHRRVDGRYRPQDQSATTGWIEYYGRYTPSAITPLLLYVNQTLCAWVMRKFKRFKGRKTCAGQFLTRIARESAGLFVHWRGDPNDAFI